MLLFKGCVTIQGGCYYSAHANVCVFVYNFYLHFIYCFFCLFVNAYWASEASPTLGCSIENSRDICMYICRYVSYVKLTA